MIKESIQQEDITLVCVCVCVCVCIPNIETTKYIKQILTNKKGEIDSNTIIVGDFNNPLTSMDRSSRQKVNKETLLLNDTLD